MFSIVSRFFHKYCRYCGLSEDMSIEVLSVRGLRPECGKVDRDLWLWFCEAKKDSENYHGPRVTKRLVQAKAKEAFQAAGIHNFKVMHIFVIVFIFHCKKCSNRIFLYSFPINAG